MELREYIHFLRRWAWLLIATAVVVGLVTFVWSSNRTPIYEATTSLMVDNRLPVDRTTPNYDALRVRDRLAITYAALLKRRLVLEETIANLALDITPGELNSRVVVEPVPDTELIHLSVSDRDPYLAAKLADEIVRVFNQQEGDILLNPYAGTGNTQSLRVIDAATINWQPVSPNISRDVILATIVALLIALAAAYLVDYFDDRLKSRADVERLTKLHVLAAIDQIPGETPADRVIVLTDPDRTISEAYRLFRASLEALLDQQQITTIAVMSSLPMEGKSTTAANLAVALAQTGKRVLLVDADLRHPMIHTLFRRQNMAGLTAALERDEWNLGDYIVPTNIDNLQLLFSGHDTPASTKLIGAERFPRFVTALRSQADIVIFDCPALLETVDAALIVNACDAALMVIRSGTTRAREVNQAKALIGQLDTPVIGAWLNGVATRQRSYDDHRNQAIRRRRLAQLFERQPTSSDDVPGIAQHAAEVKE